MTRAVLLLVLLISVAHAMVHVFELALPSTEQRIVDEFEPDDVEAGKALSGSMGNIWRLPFGMGALLAGWLVDRFGSRRMLALYLLGCGTMCIVVAAAQPLSWIYISMFAMGCFASIYHPAGLALISHEVKPEVLPRALGLHGIFGSLGIGSAPFIAGAILNRATPHWRPVYAILAVPGLALGLYFAITALRAKPVGLPEAESQSSSDQPPAHWTAFFTLSCFATLMGFVYAAVVHFLPRYIAGSQLELPGMSVDGSKNYLTGGVLLVGCVGQYLAGRFAIRDKLEPQLLLIALGNIPGLLLMALAEGYWRIAGAVVWSLIHFMHQPIYNSLIAKYTPRARRSLCYGFSFAMGFGLGSFGTRFAGAYTDNVFTFGALAGVVVIAALFCIALWKMNSVAMTNDE